MIKLAYPLLTAQQLRELLDGIPSQAQIHIDVRVPAQSIVINGPITGVIIGRGSTLRDILPDGLDNLDTEKLYVILEYWKNGS